MKSYNTKYLVYRFILQNISQSTFTVSYLKPMPWSLDTEEPFYPITHVSDGNLTHGYQFFIQLWNKSGNFRFKSFPPERYAMFNDNSREVKHNKIKAGMELLFCFKVHYW